MKKICIAIISFFTDFTANFFRTNNYDMVVSGSDLAADDAALLEKKVEQNPRNVVARTKLLGYYFRKQLKQDAARKLCQKHVLWFIINSPKSGVLATPYGTLHPISDGEAYSAGKKTWDLQLKKEPNNLKILEHSSKYFLLNDPELAQKSLEKASLLDKGNPHWPAMLGHLHSLNMMRGLGKEKVASAKKALEQFELAYKLSPGIMEEAYLNHLPKVAFAANEPVKARKYAEEMLSKSDNDKDGDHHHIGNLILGRIAFSQGNIEEAKKRLIQAGETSGSPVLGSFGPKMTLAKELLEKGEKEVVLEYFSLCSKFWTSGKAELEQWTDDIKEERIPDFGANLDY